MIAARRKLVKRTLLLLVVLILASLAAARVLGFNPIVHLGSAFWLSADPEEHMSRVIAQGDYRPMADNAEAMDDLRRILAGRIALYGKADGTVKTSGKKVDQAYRELRALVKA